MHRLPVEGGGGGGGGGGGVSEVRGGRLLVRLEGDEWEMLALPHTSSQSLVPPFFFYSWTSDLSCYGCDRKLHYVCVVVLLC